MSDKNTPSDSSDGRDHDSDTPTERFDAASDDTGAPTERFDVADRSGEADPGDAATRRLPLPQDPSADAATRRMANPGADAPTERFGQQSATPSWQPAPSDIPVYATPVAPAPRTTAPRTTPPVEKTKRSNAATTALIVIGSLLFIALVVLALVYFSGQNSTPVGASPSPTPSESATPSPTPSEEPTPTETEEPEPEPEPQPAPASFVSFSPADGTEISCPDDTSDVPLTFSWTSTDAERAWIAAGETDARANPDAGVDPSGTYRDLVFDCSRETEIYTVSLENAQGDLTNQSVTLRRALED